MGSVRFLVVAVIDDAGWCHRWPVGVMETTMMVQRSGGDENVM